MSSSAALTSSTSVSPNNETAARGAQAALQRQFTVPASFSPLQPVPGGRKQSITTAPVSTITEYIKYMLGFNSAPTKRSLSEEAESGTPDSIGEWLRRGSCVNEIDPYGYTPLINCSLRGCIKSAKILLNNGADINQTAMHGYTALHAAAQNGHLDLCELLIESGANMDEKNDDGDTPLMLAVRSNHADVVNSLCKKGSNLKTGNVDPLEYAMNQHNSFLSDVLIKHEGKNANQFDENNNENTTDITNLNIKDETGSATVQKTETQSIPLDKGEVFSQ